MGSEQRAANPAAAGAWTGTSSPVLAGRAADLAVLDEALVQALGAGPALVVLRGEAGVGKSRLVREFTARAQPTATVVQGRCVEQRDGVVPFMPFASIIKELCTAAGMDRVREVVPGGLTELGWLVPTVAEPGHAGREVSRGRLFESVLALVDLCAATSPVVVVVEDLHWVDPGSRDLLQYLVSTLGSCPVLLVLTHRPSASAQPQALPAFLSGLMRQVPALSVQLSCLDEQATAVQVAGITGADPLPDVARRIHELSGGLPLFTEALVLADGTLRQEVPPHLTELLLEGVRELPEGCREVVSTLAVGGARVAHPLLSAVTGLNDAALSRAIRPAVHTGLVVADGYGYALRHDLIRSAVRDHLLLAGERLTLHRGFATALEADPLREGGTTVTGRLRAAQHWRAAHEHVRGLESAWAAAALAQREGVVTAESAMLQQVLELWPRVPDASSRLGVDRVGVLSRAADAACWSVQTGLGLAMVEAGLELTTAPAEATRRAELLMQRASMRSLDMLPGVHEDLEEAAALAGAGSPLRHEVQAQLARSLWRRAKPAQAAAVLADLREQASPSEGAALELALTSAIVTVVEPAERAETAERVHAAAMATGQVWLAGLAARTRVEALLALGEYQHAADHSLEFLAQLAGDGLGPYLAPALSACRAAAVLALGDPGAAIEAAQDGLAEGIPRGEEARLSGWLTAALLAAGDEDAAQRVHDKVERMLSGADPEQGIVLLHHVNGIEVARSHGSAQVASERAGDLIALVGALSPAEPWAVLAPAYRALADVGRAGPAPRTAVGIASPPERAARAWLLAERARSQGADLDHDWADVATGWADVARPADAAYAWCQAATAAARTDRSRAEQHVLAAVQALASAPTHAVGGQVTAVGRRLNVRAAAPKVGGLPCGLTERELEVLRLVAAGASNAEIARELFISVKTASVHVSNILRKLEVPNRAAAGAAAFRLHLVDPADLQPRPGPR